MMLHAVCLLAIAPVAIAADGGASGTNDDRWIPSLAMTLGFTSQRAEGSVDSTRQSFIPPFPTFELRPSDTGEKYLNSPHVGGAFELQSPALPIPVVRPRFFFGGEIQHLSSQRRSIAREAQPEAALIEPEGTGDFRDVELLGLGSATEIDLENIQYGARIGISFPVQVGDWQISIKPSARYLNQELLFRGIVSEGIRIGDQPVGIPTNVILLQGSEKLDVHALGPGLEIEIETGGMRSLAASVFISGGAYRVLSDTEVSFTDTTFDSAGTPNTYRGFWTSEVDDWIYRANVGMRIKWTGSRAGWLFGLGGGL